MFYEIPQFVSCAALRSGRTVCKSRNRVPLQLASTWLLLQPAQLNVRRSNSSMIIANRPGRTPYLPCVLNSAAAVVPISRLCRSLILKRRERRHIARRCSVHKSVMDEPSAAVSTSKAELNNILSQYSDVAITTSLQPLGSVMRATHHG